MERVPDDPDVRAHHHRCLENLYVTANCNQHYRPHVHIGDGKARVRIDVRPELHHAAHALHGSVYFKVLDDAAFFAVNSRVHDVFVLTASMQIDILRPVTDGYIEATGQVIHMGRSRALADAEAHDADGRLVARGRGTFMPSQVRLGPEVGYRPPDSAPTTP